MLELTLEQTRVYHEAKAEGREEGQRSSIRAALKDYQGAMEDLKNASELHNM
ncbi:MAG: hypothetical protein RMX65_025045 [Nostoc sp. DedQUE01]|nr:hypothetical protein [Nostoc sp. DedQUE11]MDZ8075639.1 hypothetical protein [Nostoc sp. DedQUE01]